MSNDFLSELHRLYADSSKHAIYQSIPDFVSSKLGYSENIDENWRGDRPRLAWLLEHRSPLAGEHWCDFGANTGFFTLSLAHRYPQTRFTAVEANAGHAQFVRRIAGYFGLKNVEVLERTIGLESLEELRESDFLLHLNVLHHAGHDFDAPLVPDVAAFPNYAVRYLRILRTRTKGLFFQMGSNWGGDKELPIVAACDDAGKIALFSELLLDAGWRIAYLSCAAHGHEGNVVYRDLRHTMSAGLSKRGKATGEIRKRLREEYDLDRFPGEFYRRPLFLCRQAETSSEIRL